jgi:large subunit ribosomal protein L4
MNKKAKRLAMKCALSSKVAEDQMIVLDSLSFNDMKTKNMVAVLKALKVEDKALIVLPAPDANVVKSARNIPNVKTLYVNTLNVYDIIKHDKFIVTKEAVQKIGEVYV